MSNVAQRYWPGGHNPPICQSQAWYADSMLVAIDIARKAIDRGDAKEAAAAALKAGRYLAIMVGVGHRPPEYRGNTRGTQMTHAASRDDAGRRPAPKVCDRAHARHRSRRNRVRSLLRPDRFLGSPECSGSRQRLGDIQKRTRPSFAGSARGRIVRRGWGRCGHDYASAFFYARSLRLFITEYDFPPGLG